jgi:hypothetical protein
MENKNPKPYTMENITKYPKEYFLDKWYVREDLYPEQFNTNYRDIINCNIMKEVGNCFDNEEITLAKCNAIRTLLNTNLIN